MPRADRHINVERVVHMFRVVATVLLLAAAALAAVDLRDLVDIVYNRTSPLERLTPTYVFEVDGCRVLVYVADPALKNSPMTAHQTYDEVHFPRNTTLRSLTSAEVEKLLDALFQSLGPSAEAEVVVRTNFKWWCTERRSEGLRSETKDVAQLAEEVRRAVETGSAERVIVAGTNFKWSCEKIRPEVSHVEAKDAARPAEEARGAVEVGSARAEAVALSNSTWRCVKADDGDLRIEIKNVTQLAEELHRAVESENVTDMTVDGADFSLWCTRMSLKLLRVDARSAAQLAEEARRAAGVDFYLGAADAQEALKRGAEPAAFLSLVKWQRGDIVVYFVQDRSSARLEVWTANLSAAVEALEEAREAAGEVWNSVEVKLWHGPYLISDDARSALIKATLVLEEELGKVWKFRDEEGQARQVRGTVDFFIGGVGPSYVIFPYPNGTVLDKTTAERLVRRFVELSGFCKSPLVVEFWPRPGLEPQPLWQYAVAVALAVAVGLFVLTRRRR